MDSKEERLLREIETYTLKHGRFQFPIIEGIRSGFIKFSDEFQCSKFQCICLN